MSRHHHHHHHHHHHRHHSTSCNHFFADVVGVEKTSPLFHGNLEKISSGSKPSHKCVNLCQCLKALHVDSKANHANIMLTFLKVIGDPSYTTMYAMTFNMLVCFYVVEMTASRRAKRWRKSPKRLWCCTWSGAVGWRCLVQLWPEIPVISMAKNLVMEWWGYGSKWWSYFMLFHWLVSNC